MGHLPCMDDFTPDIRTTLDDAVDAGELLSFRYPNLHNYSLSVCHTNIVSQSRALDTDRYTNVSNRDLRVS